MTIKKESDANTELFKDQGNFQFISLSGSYCQRTMSLVTAPARRQSTIEPGSGAETRRPSMVKYSAGPSVASVSSLIRSIPANSLIRKAGDTRLTDEPVADLSDTLTSNHPLADVRST